MKTKDWVLMVCGVVAGVAAVAIAVRRISAIKEPSVAALNTRLKSNLTELEQRLSRNLPSEPQQVQSA